MTSVLIKRSPREEREIPREGHVVMEDWSDAFISQETPKVAGKPSEAVRSEGGSH
jgi:hypothetical protein